MRELHSALPEQRSALPEQRSESHRGAVRHAVRVAHPSRGSRVVVAEFASAERRRAVRPVPKATASHPRVVAEAAVEFESAAQPRVAGSMPEATVLQRRAAVAPGSARSFAEAEAGAQARRLAESEVSAAQAAVVLPAA